MRAHHCLARLPLSLAARGASREANTSTGHIGASTGSLREMQFKENSQIAKGKLRSPILPRQSSPPPPQAAFLSLREDVEQRPCMHLCAFQKRAYLQLCCCNSALNQRAVLVVPATEVHVWKRSRPRVGLVLVLGLERRRSWMPRLRGLRFFGVWEGWPAS